LYGSSRIEDLWNVATVKEVLNGISGISVDLDWKKENKFNALPRHRLHRNCSAVISDETGAIG